MELATFAYTESAAAAWTRWWVINVEREARACAGCAEQAEQAARQAASIEISYSRGSFKAIQHHRQRHYVQHGSETTCNLALWSWLVSDGSAAAAAAAAAVAIVAAFVLMIVPLGVSYRCRFAACSFTAACRMTSVALALPPLPAYQCNILHVAGKQKPRSTSWAFVTVAHTHTHTHSHTPAPDKQTLYMCLCVCARFFVSFFFCFLAFFMCAFSHFIVACATAAL